MQFKNLKAAELDGRVDLPGLAEWIRELRGDEVALLITAPAGTGKSAAVGAIARKLKRDVMQCDLLQVFRYPDSREALRNILTIAENLRHILFQAEGIDRISERFAQTGDAGALEDVREWLATKRNHLREHEVTFVATGRSAGAVPAALRAQFEQAFAPVAG
ncbi:MAG: AAA family ATPase [Armatimonadetes bacterium]|nr:AAA family ATPase [Armatimonadota bacterium]